MGRRSKFRSVEIPGTGIVEEPVFAGFETTDDRVAGGSFMSRRVLGRRVIAAADVSALGAPAKMQPPAAVGLAFNATGPAGGNRNIDSRYGVHCGFPSDSRAIDHSLLYAGGGIPHRGKGHRRQRSGSTSRPVRSQCPVSAAASYVDCRNRSSVLSGSGAVRTFS